MIRGRVVCLFLYCVVSATAGAAERHLGPHVHGQATVNLSTQGDALDVELSLPGHDAVGFEHPPSTNDEKQALAKASASIAGAVWLQPAAAADCTLGAHTVRANGYGDATEAGGHADFDAAFHFDCRHPEKLDRVDIGLSNDFSTLQKIVVNMITAAGSSQQTLEGKNTLVGLAQ